MLHREEATPATFSGFSGNKLHLDKPTEGIQKFETLLPTAIVSVVNSENQLLQCRALLDSGLQLSFITNFSEKIQADSEKDTTQS